MFNLIQIFKFTIKSKSQKAHSNG